MKKILLLLLTILSLTGCEKEEKVKAVWWWDDELGIEYLDFAKEKDINTIYYCSSKFNEETADFIKKANDYNMEVYFLTGDYTWLENKGKLSEKIIKFEEYQANYKYKFKGIHFDIEPHQHSDFENIRTDLITKLIEIAYELKDKKYDVEYDIPFWLEDEIEFNNVKKEAYKHLIDYADSITIMSYRDTKEAILDVAEDEYLYADSINKNILVSVETYSKEGDSVSFYEEGVVVMEQIVNEIYESDIAGINGIAVHHIKNWYSMK